MTVNSGARAGICYHAAQSRSFGHMGVIMAVHKVFAKSRRAMMGNNRTGSVPCLPCLDTHRRPHTGISKRSFISKIPKQYSIHRIIGNGYITTSHHLSYYGMERVVQIISSRYITDRKILFDCLKELFSNNFEINVRSPSPALRL